MKQQNFDINKMRVASPCSVGWESMTGDERVRRCDSCELNIYNIAEMTKPEVENLVKTHEGRLCIRLYKRADGTVLTKDCPVGFRAYQKRVVRFAGAALSMVLGLFSVGFGQTKDKDSDNKSNIKIIRTENQYRESVLSGVITDALGAVIPNAEIRLTRKGEINARKISSNSEGNYIFSNLVADIYIFEIKAAGFKAFKIKKLKIKNKEKINLNVSLDVDESEIIGIIFADNESSIDPKPSSMQPQSPAK